MAKIITITVPDNTRIGEIADYVRTVAQQTPREVLPTDN